jgi:zinc protease
MSAPNAPSAAAPDRSAPPAAGELRPFHFPAVERRALSNGIPVVLARIDRFPVVTVSVSVDAGGLRDEPERSGIAALTASLLESGAGGMSAADIAREVESLGLSLDTGAGWDTTHAGLTALRSRIEPATEILASLLREPTFPTDEVERLRAERLAEIQQRRADPRGLASEMAARFIFSDETRLSRPLGGTASEVVRLTRQEIAGFHAGNIVSASSSIVVVGDLDPDEAMDLLETRFGDWGGVAVAVPTSEIRERSTVRRVVLLDRPGAVQSEIRVGHLGLARDAEWYFPVVVMNAILGGMFSSRLNLNLRERNGFTYGASSGFAMRRRPGSFQVSTAVQTEVTGAAVREIVGELERIREAPVTVDELEDARNYFAGVFPLRLQTTDGIAGRLLELMVYRLPADYFETYRDRVLAVTADDVLAAARRFVRPQSAAIVIAGDAAALRPQLEALDLGEIHVVSPEEIRSMD